MNKVSIIIPTFNRGTIITETLDSITAQTHLDWECLIIDDGSIDSTESVINDYSLRDDRFIYHKRPRDRTKGANACRNYGFEQCSGEFIQWFDSDDIMLPEKLALKIELLNANPSSDFVVCEGADIGEGNEKPVKIWSLQNEGNLLLNHIRGIVVFGTNGPLFRRSYLENLTLFDESLSIRQEWEFFSRLLMKQPEVGFLYKVLYHYKTFDSGIRRNNNYARLKGVIKAERKLLNTINKKDPFNENDTYIYRRSVINRVKKHLPIALRSGKIAGVFFLISTLLRTLNFTFVSNGFKRVFNRKSI